MVVKKLVRIFVMNLLALSITQSLALIQLDKGVTEQPDMETDEVEAIYNKLSLEANELMQAKNHDYGEAWRDMRVSSLTDLILQKFF